MLHILLHDKEAVNALEKEFENYLKLCRPLIQIVNASSPESTDLYPKLEKAHGDLLSAHALPSAYAVPKSVIQSFRMRSDPAALQRFITKSSALFREQLRRGDSITEILHLPHPDAFREGRIKVPFSDLFGNGDLSIRPEEMRLILKNVIRMLRRNPGYHVVLSKQIPENIDLRVKESFGTILAHSVPPTTAFVTSEPNMTSAFREYLARIREDALYSSPEVVIRQLALYISRL